MVMKRPDDLTAVGIMQQCFVHYALVAVAPATARADFFSMLNTGVLSNELIGTP